MEKVIEKFFKERDCIQKKIKLLPNAKGNWFFENRSSFFPNALLISTDSLLQSVLFLDESEEFLWNKLETKLNNLQKFATPFLSNYVSE